MMAPVETRPPQDFQKSRKNFFCILRYNDLYFSALG